ncbi:MAG: carboxypeptidase-like regulatory domain-containing protein [Bacteroidota bacterium]
MKRFIIITAAILISLSSGLMAGNDGDGNSSAKANNSSASINGIVLDKASGENLAGVTIKVEGTDMVIYSDLEGNFVIPDLKPGTYNLVISYISYNKSFVENITVQGGQSRKLNIHLVEQEQ